jgi:lipid IVA palmitoyltransferase
LKRCVLALVVLFGLPGRALALECADFWTWVETGCRHVVDTYEQGDNALLVSGYQWHIPYSWSPEKRAQENEDAWGAGWARSREHLNGDTENVFFLVFDDSHRQPQLNLGYTWTTYWLDRSGIQPGLGFTAAFIQRPDIANGWPIPVALPLFTLRYQKVEVLTTYIPKLNNGINHGDVLYVFGKIDLK